MKKNGTVKKTASTIIFAGLLVSLLSATLSSKAQQPLIMEEVVRQEVSKAPKLSQEEIDHRIGIIKRSMKKFAAVKTVVPLLVFGTKAAIVAIIGRVMGLEMVTSMASLVALSAFVVTPIAMFLSAIGLSGFSLLTAVEVVGELEQVEKDYPGTLTWKQRRILGQLKNMAKQPIIRGIIEYFTLDHILNIVVDTAMKKSLILGAVALGQPQEIHKIVAKYIKIKWMEQNARKAVERLAKSLTPEFQGDYKKADKVLQKLEQQIQDLEENHPYLAKDPELKNAVQEFKEKANRILEGLKKQALEKEEPKPIQEAETFEQVVVPL